MQKNTKSDKRLTFCILPFLETPIDKTYNIGPYQIWANTPENWEIYIGNFDAKQLTDQYRDKDDIPLGNRITVITHANPNKAVLLEEFRGVIVCLSTAEWISDGTAGADRWVFEYWEIGASAYQEDRVYCRASKFSLQFNSVDYDRLHPTPYMGRRLQFELYEPEQYEKQDGEELSRRQQLLRFISGQLAADRHKSLIGVMYRFHKIRFETPYYTSVGDDLDAMWSGFELLFLPRSIAPSDVSTDVLTPEEEHEPAKKSSGTCSLRTRMQCWLDDNIIWRLRKPEKRPRTDRAERLANEILKEFQAELDSKLVDREFFEEGVKLWAKKLYSKRNNHSHGGDSLPVLDEILPKYRNTIFRIGLTLAKEIFAFRIFHRNFSNSEQSRIAKGFFYFSEHNINLLFSEAPLTDAVVNFVNEIKKADQWHTVGGVELTKFSETLWKFSRMERIGNLYYKNKTVLYAAYKMSKVLSSFAQNSNLQIIKPNISLKEIYSKITQILAEEKQELERKQQEDKIMFPVASSTLPEVSEERELRKQNKFMSKLSFYCEQNLFHRGYNYKVIDDAQRKQTMIVGQIDVWIWIASMSRLSKLYNGN